jgi:hypothetical protein
MCKKYGWCWNDWNDADDVHDTTAGFYVFQKPGLKHKKLRLVGFPSTRYFPSLSGAMLGNE